MNLVPHFLRGVRQLSHDLYGGIIHQDMERPEAGQGGVHRSPDVLRLGDVGKAKLSFPSLGTNRGNGLLGGLFIPVDGDNGRAFFRETLCGRLSYSRTCSRNDGHLASKLHIILLRSILISTRMRFTTRRRGSVVVSASFEPLRKQEDQLVARTLEEHLSPPREWRARYRQAEIRASTNAEAIAGIAARYTGDLGRDALSRSGPFFSPNSQRV